MKACVSHITQLVRFSNSLSSQLRNLTNTCNAPSELNWVLLTLSKADLSDNPLLWHWDHSGCEGRGFQVDLLPKTVGLLLLVDLGFPHWGLSCSVIPPPVFSRQPGDQKHYFHICQKAFPHPILFKLLDGSLIIGHFHWIGAQ